MTHASNSALKDTGIPWLGRLPADWTVQPIKHGSYIKARVGWKGLSSDEFETSSYAYLVTGTDFRGQFIDWKSCYQVDEERYLDDPFIQLRNGDLLITKDGTIGKLSLVSGLDKPACLNSGIFLVRPQESYSTRFLYWVLSSRIFEDYVALTSTGSTILHLYQNVFEQFSFGFPSLDAQTSIADFLDRETAQIDDLIIMQERLIALLAEKRQATITNGVTKGLDPTAPTKPSGIPWLGDIPAAWSLSKLSRRSSGIGDGLHGTPTYSDQGSIPFVNGTNLLGGEIRITDSTNFVEEDQLSVADISLDESTVLISINGTIGNCAVLGDQRVMLSKSAAYIKCAEGMSVHFLAHYLRSDPTRSYFFASSGGTTIANLSLATLRGTPVPVPPIQVQEEIFGWLNARLNVIDELRAKASQAVRLLRERRSALISAAVTGKIDVPEGVA